RRRRNAQYWRTPDVSPRGIHPRPHGRGSPPIVSMLRVPAQWHRASAPAARAPAAPRRAAVIRRRRAAIIRRRRADRPGPRRRECASRRTWRTRESITRIVTMPRLLVSVRDVREAEAALAGGADLIDIKEPAHGPLGRADDAVIEFIVQT